MIVINKRLKQVRQSYGLTQQQFAETIKVSRNYIGLIEIGQREPSDRTISDICREFNVNEKWLRTGEGSMFVPKTLYQEMGEIVQAASRADPEKARKFFDYLLDGMTEADVILMYQVFRRTFPDLFREDEKKGSS